MDTREEIQEKKAKRTGLVIAISIHAVLALLFFFLIAWREPDPPLPEYGFELVGLDAEGGGDLEQTQPAQEESEPMDESAPEEPNETAQPEEVTEPEVEESTPEPVEETIEEPVEEAKTIETESPDVREEKPKPKPVEETPKPKTEEKKSQPAEKTENTTETTAKSGNKESGKSSSDTGSKPSVDERGLYKGPSKGPGSAAKGDFEGGSYEGFEGFAVPDFEYVDEKQEFGTMKFEIKIDAYGYVESVRVLQSDFRPEIRLKYERFLRDLKFDPKNNNLPGATGTVTYVIKAR
ncbi:hypothetical protein AB9P05_19010 [Roseivirga sp. BDSF3-8]|uniref:hypothetical protein n=1 Tax=Roseivirga sp. BDSF3-8 TaxID=3241598 RepID=UPI003531F578